MVAENLSTLLKTEGQGRSHSLKYMYVIIKTFMARLLVFWLAASPDVVAGLSAGVGRDFDVLDRVQIGPNGDLVGEVADKEACYALSRNLGAKLAGMLGELSQKHQVVLVHAAVESMVHPDDYIELAAGVLGGVASGDISSEVGMAVLMPHNETVQGVLAVNAGDPRVRSILPSLIERYSSQPEIAKHVEDLMSGKAAEDHVRWSKAQGIMMPGRVGGWAQSGTNHTAASSDENRDWIGKILTAGKVRFWVLFVLVLVVLSGSSLLWCRFGKRSLGR